ncbi:hypothetical protein HZY88_08515 [Aerococcaceae bacterium DSM 111176]|nr:hypothetical protein [Aerococcaceae bacterium DSM 111176]
MNERELICAVCGNSFYTTANHAKYCGSQCREIGTKRVRNDWEKNTDYNDKVKLLMQEKRAAQRQEKNEALKAERLMHQQAQKAKDEEVAKVKREKLLAKAEAGDLRALRVLASERGDLVEQWRLYKEMVLQSADKTGRYPNHIVGGVSLYDEDFEHLVAEQLEKNKK